GHPWQQGEGGPFGPSSCFTHPSGSVTLCLRKEGGDDVAVGVQRTEPQPLIAEALGHTAGETPVRGAVAHDRHAPVDDDDEVAVGLHALLAIGAEGCRPDPGCGDGGAATAAGGYGDAREVGEDASAVLVAPERAGAVSASHRFEHVVAGQRIEAEAQDILAG